RRDLPTGGRRVLRRPRAPLPRHPDGIHAARADDRPGRGGARPDGDGAAGRAAGAGGADDPPSGACGTRPDRLHRPRDGADDGEDETRITIGHVMKSVGHEKTLLRDTADREVLRATLAMLCDATATELREHEQTARIVHLRVRARDFRTVTMQRTIAPATNAQQ